MKRRNVLLGLGAVGASCLGFPAFGQAQRAFPQPGTNIKYIVPFAAGGLTDIMARVVGQKLSDEWKVPVIVENKGGGNAQTGADFVAKGIADGTQILAITQSHSVNVALFPNAPFSLAKDLRPIAYLADSPMLIVVPVNSPIKDFRDLMAVSKARVLNGGSAGSGSAPHLTQELFNDLNGSKIVHVPYKGGAPSMTDLVGGHLDISFSNYPQSLSFVKAGKLRALAICSTTRHPDLPNVPTARESGMPDLVVENWTAVMAPAKTPDAVVERYSQAFLKIMAMPDIVESLKQKGFRVNAKGSEEFGRYLKTEIDRWGRVVKAADIKPE